MIKSRKDWDSQMQQVGPFAKLSSGTQAKFSEGLHFCDDGLCSFYYGDVENELSHQDYKELMASFGVDVSKGLDPSMLDFKLEPEVNMAELKARLDGVIVFGFLKDHRCVDRGTCKQDGGYSCTSNCYAPNPPSDPW